MPPCPWMMRARLGLCRRLLIAGLPARRDGGGYRLPHRAAMDPMPLRELADRKPLDPRIPTYISEQIQPRPHPGPSRLQNNQTGTTLRWGNLSLTEPPRHVVR